MMTNLLFSTAESSVQSVGDKISLSLTTLVLGMLVVFAVLLLIMLVIMIVGKIFQKVESKKTAGIQPVSVNDMPSASEITEESETDGGEIVAAITAAIASCLEEEQQGSFRVVSFRKTSSKPAWNKNK